MTHDGSGEFYLSEVSSGDVKFDIHKAISSEIARLYDLQTNDGVTGFVSGSRFIGFDKYAIKINSCGSWLRFVEADGKIKLVDARFCSVPNCSMCQWRRSLKWRAKFLSLLPDVQKNYPTHKWVFLTLTIRNCELDDLKATLTHLHASYNRLSKLKRFPMDGYAKSLEVTRVWDCYHEGEFIGRHGTKWIVRWEYQNKKTLHLEPTTEVHPHLHVCGLVPASYFSTNYIKHEEWQALWKQCLRVDYEPIVNIKAVKPKNKANSVLPEPEQFNDNPNLDESGMIQAICETLKYTVKEQDLIGSYCQDKDANSSWLKKMTQQLYKARKVEYRGVLKEIGKQIEVSVNDGDLININEDKEVGEVPDKELEFRWKAVLQKYVFSYIVDKTILSMK